MKRVLIVFETFNYSYDAVNVAIEMAKQDGSHLHMKFLKPLHADEASDYPFPNDLSLSDEEREGKEQEDMKLIKADLRIFRDQCNAAGINYKIEGDREVSIENVLEESAFADLIIAHAAPEMGKYSMKELLTDTHCPVLLLPTAVSNFDNIILAYDGSSSSTLAIKLFSYLFPMYKNKKTWLLSYTGKEREEGHMKGITEWLKIHFQEAEMVVEKGEVRTELLKFIEGLDGNALVVMGAFGRKGFARLLHKSLSYTILDKTKAAIFSMHE